MAHILHRGLCHRDVVVCGIRNDDQVPRERRTELPGRGARRGEKGLAALEAVGALGYGARAAVQRLMLRIGIALTQHQGKATCERLVESLLPEGRADETEGKGERGLRRFP